MTKPTLGLGLIGAGFMGKSHAMAYRAAPQVFDLPADIRLKTLADIDDATAARNAAALVFEQGTGDWRTLIDDPEIQIVAITAPNQLHREMALAAIAAGKHVHCEKPLAPTAAEAEEMTKAAEKASVATQVGFNYLKNPLIALARDLIATGELGEVRTFRGVHAEDYMADAAQPWTWRMEPEAGGGAFADLGSHITAMARHLVGPIATVEGRAHTIVRQRPGPDGAPAVVTIDDLARAHVTFENGAVGALEANWLATGRKMQLDFEIYCAKGALIFSQERLNELRIHRKGGFQTILAGPEHPPYAAFCPAPGHQLGFNDLKVIEARDFVAAIAGGEARGPDFREGWQVQRVVDAVYRSSDEGRAISL
jgi:predicted dehydrogenase